MSTGHEPSDPVLNFLTERTNLAQRLAAGESRAVIYAELVTLFDRAQDSGDVECEDLYADLLDCLDGWCAAHLRL